MNIIAVDDEQFSLMDLESAIREALPDSTLFCFDSPLAAIEHAKNNIIDVAFLDIEMGSMNGLQLAKHLKDIYGKTNCVFVTGYSQYAVDAFALHASGYLLKPVTPKAVTEAIEYLRYSVRPFHPKPASDKKLYIQTFGNFEIFADGKPVIFTRIKTKELFAYLVSRRGAHCSNNEITAVIWEDKKDSPSLKSLFRNLIADLTHTLNALGMSDVIIKQRGYLALAVDKVSCDLYDFCNGIEVNSYMGEFMAQYTWAEFTNAYLERITHQIKH